MMVLPLPTTAYVYFTRISLLSGCRHGAEDGKAPLEPTASVGVSQVRTHHAGPYPQKADPCGICCLVLKHILDVALHQRTHPQLRSYTCRKPVSFIANLHQHGKQHRGEKLLKWASFVKSCRSHVSGKSFTCGEVDKNFLTGSGKHQHQATHNGQKAHSCTMCGEAVHSWKSRYSWCECKKTLQPRIHSCSMPECPH